MELKDKLILITGSTDGVGRRVAQWLGSAGATVLIHGRDRTRAVLKIELKSGPGERLGS